MTYSDWLLKQCWAHTHYALPSDVGRLKIESKLQANKQILQENTRIITASEYSLGTILK